MAKLSMKPKKSKIYLSLRQRQAIAGYLFVSPFLIGFILIFLIPLIKSMSFAFSNLSVGIDGYTLEFIGLEHFKELFLVDTNFRKILVSSIVEMVSNVPVILIFSFFIAFLISKNFKGRTIARSIFFLPVILTSGIIVAMESSDLLLAISQNAEAVNSGFQFSSGIVEILQQFKIDPSFVNYISGLVDGLYSIISACGVQMLIFLIGIQSIPPSLYEASNIEGATGWENFWKITFPMVTPLILVNTIYSIIDSFTRTNGELLKTISDTAFLKGNYGYSSAISLVYFVIVIFIIFIITKVINKFTFYYD